MIFQQFFLPLPAPRVIWIIIAMKHPGSFALQDCYMTPQNLSTRHWMNHWPTSTHRARYNNTDWITRIRHRIWNTSLYTIPPSRCQQLFLWKWNSYTCTRQQSGLYEATPSMSSPSSARTSSYLERPNHTLAALSWGLPKAFWVLWRRNPPPPLPLSPPYPPPTSSYLAFI